TLFSPLTLQNGWANLGSTWATAGESVDGDTVTVKGSIQSGTFADGTTLTTLDVGYRPTEKFLVWAYNANSLCWLTVDTDGSVKVSGATSNGSLAFYFTFRR
ncbi:MAG: hypothetical protein ABR563_12400, partial [Pyrinomonadaceae bacterium]